MKQRMTLYIILFLFSLAASYFSYADTVSSTTVTNSTENVTPSDTVTNSAEPASKTTVTKSTTTVTVSDTDAKIIAAVYSKYAKEAALIGTKLTVNCADGNVTISGSVTTQSQNDAAVQAAKSVDGVKTVVSTIDVTTHPITTQPAPVSKY